jgi:hypothetical protein
LRLSPTKKEWKRDVADYIELLAFNCLTVLFTRDEKDGTPVDEKGDVRAERA